MGIGRGGFLANFLAGLAGGYSQSQDRNQERKFRQQQYDLEKARLDQSASQFGQEQADKLKYQQAAAVQAYGGNSPESIQRGAAIMGGQFPKLPATAADGTPYFIAAPSTPVNYPGGTDPFAGIKPQDPGLEQLSKYTAATAHLYQNPQAILNLSQAQQQGPVPQQGAPGFQYQPQGGGQPPPTIGGFPTAVPAKLGVEDYLKQAGGTVESQREAAQLQRETMREAARTSLLTARDTLGQYKTKTQARTAIIGKYIQAGGAPEYAGTYADSILQGFEPAATTPPSPAGAAGPPVKAGAAPGLGGSLDIAKMFPKGTTAQAGIDLKGAQGTAALSHANLWDTYASLAPEKQKAMDDYLAKRGVHLTNMDKVARQRALNDAAYQQGKLTLGQGQLDLGKRRADIASYNVDINAEVKRARINIDQAGLSKGVNQARIQGYNQQIGQMGQEVNRLNNKAADGYAQGDKQAGDYYAQQAKDLAEKHLQPLIDERQKYYQPAAAPPQIQGIGRRGGVPNLGPPPPGTGNILGGGPPGGILRRGGPPTSRAGYEADLRAHGATPAEIAQLSRQKYGQ